MAKDDDIIDDHQGTRVKEELSPRSGPCRKCMLDRAISAGSP